MNQQNEWAQMNVNFETNGPLYYEISFAFVFSPIDQSSTETQCDVWTSK